MSTKGVMSVVLLMAFLLSAVCMFVITPEVAAEEDDDIPTVFVIEERDWNPGMSHSPDRIDRTIRIIGEFELVSERMDRQNFGPGAYVDYPGMDDMSPMERNLVKDMAHLVGLKGVCEGDVPGYNAVTISFEYHDFDTIGTHDPRFISEAVEYLEADAEYDKAAEVLEHIVKYNQSNVEDLGRAISCADTRASGNMEEDAECEDDICIVDSESDGDVQNYEDPMYSVSNVFSAATDVFVETSLMDFKL